MQNRRSFRVSLLLVLVAVSFGCATMLKEADRTALLKAGAEKYWKLRFEDNYKAAYEMEYPTGLPEFDAYREKASLIKKFKPESFSVDKVDVEGDKGIIWVGILFYMPNVPKPFRQVLYDNWIFTDGEWLHRFPAK
jgi:hypothetical protein